jgi:DNA-binding Lrp family transcriptional regulator
LDRRRDPAGVGDSRENARFTIEDLARQTDLSESEIEATIDDLEAAGAIRGYQAVVDWAQVDEERVRASVELNVTLDRETSYADIATRVAEIPAVESLHLVSGDYDFDLTVAGDSMREVSAVVSDDIAPIPEITQTVTHYVMETYKHGGIDFGDGDEDDRLSVSP